MTEPTHKRGHTSDLLISKSVAILNVDVDDVVLSDHFCVFFDLSVSPKLAVGSAIVQGRLINDSTGTQFMEMITFENTPCYNVDGLFNSYPSRVLRVLDTIAPVKVRMVISRQKAGEKMGKRRLSQGTENGVPEN